MERPQWRHHWPLYLAFVLAFPLAMACVETHPLNGPTICPFRLVTHLDCPSCGMTRAFRAMGRLDVRGAMGYNPLGPLLFLVVLSGWGYAIVMLLTRGRISLPPCWTRWRRTLCWSGLALYLLVGIARVVYEAIH
jgi:hypothetical protein